MLAFAILAAFFFRGFLAKCWVAIKGGYTDAKAQAKLNQVIGISPATRTEEQLMNHAVLTAGFARTLN